MNRKVQKYKTLFLFLLLDLMIACSVMLSSAGTLTSLVEPLELTHVLSAGRHRVPLSLSRQTLACVVRIV